MFRIISISVALFILLAGCANLNTVNRRFNPSNGDSRLIDAKQRAIISVIDKNTGDVRICAEPSPDALAATAAALGGSGEAQDTFIQAAFSTSEGAASIGLRTQSIQLLRDAFYRICEAHLNGGLDTVSFDILQRRYQNHMIAFLAVEQLTGATVAAQANISSVARAESEAASQNLQKQINDSRAELNRLMGEREELNKEKQAKDTAEPSAEGAQKEALKKESDSLADQIEQLTTAINTENARLSALTTASTTVEKDKAKANTGALASVGDPNAGGQNAANIEAVADAVENITLAAMDQGYAQQTCLEGLRARVDDTGVPDLIPVGSTYLNFCNRFLAAIANGQADLIADQIHTNRAKAHALENLARALARSGNAENIIGGVESGFENIGRGGSTFGAGSGG